MSRGGIVSPLATPLISPLAVRLGVPGGAGEGIPLVGRDAVLYGATTLTRASGGISVEGGVYRIVGSNLPRQRNAHLLVEGQAMNAISNPWFVGAVVGTPGTNATGLSLAGTGTGVQRSVSAVGVLPNGLPYIDITFTGTATASSITVVGLDVATTTAAATGDVWSMSPMLAMIAGDPSKMSVTLAHRLQDSAGTTIGGGGITSAALAITSTLTRFPHTGTLTTANVAYVQPTMRFQYTSGVTYAETLRIVAGNEERLGVSSIILPPQGTVAYASRATESLAYALPVSMRARGTLVGTFVLTGAPVAGMTTGLFGLSDASGSNRIEFRTGSGNNVATVSRRDADVVTSSTETTVRLPGAGVAFKAALAWDERGVVAYVGGSAISSLATSGAAPAIDRLYVGQAERAFVTALEGEIVSAFLYPYRLPDAALASLAT